MSRPIRRTQAISPFGIGALVDFPGPVSLVHAGLDAWPFDERNNAHREFRIDDESRLSRRLEVDFFVEPPDFRAPTEGQPANRKNLNLRLPFLRFPLWHVCPRCGRMHPSEYHHSSPPICRGPIGSGEKNGEPHSPRKTIQVRFVAACARGHLTDFPWLQWLFKESNPQWKPDGESRWLRMRSSGSASLTGVEVRAEERISGGGIRVVERRTLAGAFGSDATTGSGSAFSKIGVTCSGHNPAMAIGHSSIDAPGCGQELHPLLRGASNLYFPQVVSSIYIPEIDDRELAPEVLDLLEDHQFKTFLFVAAQNSDDGLLSLRAATNVLRLRRPESSVDPAALAGAANKHLWADILLGDRKIHAFLTQKLKIASDKRLSFEMVDSAIKSFSSGWAIDPALLLCPLSKKLEGLSSDADEAKEVRQDTLSESDYRREEYRVFCRDIQDGFPKNNLLIRSAAIESYGDVVSRNFERISLLHKLRETRAFVGFSRLYPDNDLTQEERWQLIAREKKKWLPAVIVRGEGVFLKFREDQLSAWLEKQGVGHEERLCRINHSFGELRIRRKQQPRTISPKHVLIHTFAHLLINQLVYECGYGSASLKERIYVADGESPMSGVLIYTAAGDSEGTMGGLVKMGQPGHLERVVSKALEAARWCSSDPVCIEAEGQGPDNCNLAACHSCALLPETSCEEQNRLLDRGVVVGTLENRAAGFFGELSL